MTASKIIKTLTALFLVLDCSAFSKTEILTEARLIEMAKTKSIYLHSIKAENNSKQYQSSAYQEQYVPYLTSSFATTGSNEPMLTQPAASSVDTLGLSVGYAQKLKYGVSLSADLYTQATEFGDFVADEQTKNGAKLNVELDLWKNVFGSFERQLEASFNAESVKAKEILDLKTNEHVQTVRSLYWAIVANEEQQNLRKMIIESTDKQKTQALRQKKLYVSDGSDVARFTSLAEAARSQLIMLRYNRERLNTELKKLFPELRGKTIRYSFPKMEDVSTSVMSCVNDIANNSMPPINKTSWAKVIKATEVAADMKLANNRQYDYPELKLQGSFEYFDQEFSGPPNPQSDSYNGDFGKNTVALSLNVPLGSKKTDAQKWENYTITQAKLAEVNQYKASIATAHEETLRLIALLKEAIDTQEKVNTLNEKTLDLSRQKYKRAEMLLINLINDETSYLTGKVSEVETRLMIVNTLLGYFKVFDSYQCSFNQISLNKK